ncbi:MAG: hypothetical protein IPG71_09930 [bacterium]|nr:hypothetical protein [bacterium]
MTRSTVFLPAADRYLPTALAAASALIVLAATHLWGIAVDQIGLASLLSARELAGGAKFEFLAPSYPAGPVWPLLLAQFARLGYAIEFVARGWQALMLGMLLYVTTRFYLRHIRSRALVGGTAIGAATGLLLLGEPFTLSPLMTALFLLTCGVLALSRFLLEDEVLTFIGAALCFGLAALVWLPAIVMATGAALAILLGGRGNLTRRLSGVIFFSALAVLPPALCLIQSGLPARQSFGAEFIDALSGASAWTMWATWPLLLRIALTAVVIGGLLYVYFATRGPAGIGPALKRRELQVWILLTVVWLGHLLILPATSTFAPLVTGVLLWPALGIDSFRDFHPINSLLNGNGSRVVAACCAVLLAIPLWQTALAAKHQFDAGGGLLGFRWQTTEFVLEGRHAAAPLYSDAPEVLAFILNRDARKLPDDLLTLELVEGTAIILGDRCPEGVCGDKSTHPTLVFESRLTSPEGMIYDIRFRPAEPALTASDSLTLP